MNTNFKNNLLLSLVPSYQIHLNEVSIHLSDVSIHLSDVSLHLSDLSIHLSDGIIITLKQ